MPALTGSARVEIPVRTENTRVRAGIVVAAEDGVPLATDVYRPREAPRPAVILRTYLGKAQHRPEALGWIENGFGCVVQDVRGRYDSGGTWVPFAHEREDGRTTAEWVSRQPWCDGRVVLTGGSYGAFTAWAAAVSGHPAICAVIASVPAMRPVDYSPGPDGGVLPLLGHVSWWLTHGDARCSRDGLAEAMLDAEPDLLGHLPVAELPTRLWASLPGWLAAATAGADAPPPIGDSELAALSVPSLHIGGWHDPFCGETLHQWATVGGAHEPRPPRGLVIGPWTHQVRGHVASQYGERDYGAASRFPLGGFQAAWLHSVLDNREAPADLPAFEAPHVFVTGENRWSVADPVAIRDRLIFHATSGTRLSTESASESGQCSFLYDPEDPFPARRTPIDERDISARVDVARFTTAPLPAACRWLGEARVILWASTDAPATDWVARILEVLPDGRSLYVAHGLVDAVRALFRRGEALRPDRPYQFEIPLSPMAITIPAGHRLQLEITSSAFPSYARNLASGEDRLFGHSPRQARQTVHWGPPLSTRLELPVSPLNVPDVGAAA
ncbi:MAG: CocE/NonD family hydrolase [Thermoanaerobaculia bacterium]|nr:CocE/NonD family hydrolase [Thermoanaerobaculia bacterium]